MELQNIKMLPYVFTTQELVDHEFTEVQRAKLQTIAWNQLMSLAFNKRLPSVDGSHIHIGSLQDEAYRRGRLDMCLELLNLTEADLFAVSVDTGDIAE